MLSDRYPESRIRASLLPRARWHPYPDHSDRGAWSALPATVRAAHIARAEDLLDHQWPALPATLFLEFSRTGNRANYESLSFARRRALCNLVIAECMEAEGRFLDDILNGVWAICEESFWGIPACLYMQEAGYGLPDVTEPVVPLFVGETVALMAWIEYLLGPALDSVSPLIRPRTRDESVRRVLAPCLERDDFWWMGFNSGKVNNWNPWVNSNWLTAVLVFEEDLERRASAVSKIVRSLEHFINSYPADGGCDEGPNYWGKAGASLFDCLELLHFATNGAIDVFDEPLIHNIGQYIYRAQIAERWFVNFADAPALLAPSPCVVYRYADRINDDFMKHFAGWSAKVHEVEARGVTGSISRQLPALFGLDAVLSTDPSPALPRDVWFPGIQVMTARDNAGSARGFFVAAKGGHNAESHNHNDVGSFIVSIDGRPLLVDAGVEAYTAKTFSPQRYEIWTMQSGWHNLVTVNGIEQINGQNYAASSVSHRADDRSAALELDLASAFPAEAGIIRWTRKVELIRGRSISVTDDYDLSTETPAIRLSLVTPCDVSADGAHLTLSARPLEGDLITAAGVITLPEGSFDISTEIRELDDSRMKSIWGGHLTRIFLDVRNPVSTGHITVTITK